MMDKQRKQQLVLVALVIFSLIMLPKVLFKKKPQAATRQPLSTGAPQGRALDTADVAPVQKALPQAGAPKAVSAGQDPFDLPGDLQEKWIIEEDELTQEREGENLPNVNLLGVVWGGDTPIAFIDDKAYKIGDKISEAEIIDIDKKGVYFLYNGEKVLMRLKKEKLIDFNN